MDAAGKDGTIKHVMSGVNPQGCQVFSFKKPSAEELDHNFLWRYMRCLPERGRIGIFNRSYYEDVLVVKVHPELLGRAAAAGREASGRSSGTALRGHQRVRAAPGPQRDGDPQVLPERLEGRAEAAVPGAARPPGEELEVLPGRPGRAGPLGPSTCGRTRTACRPPAPRNYLRTPAGRPQTVVGQRVRLLAATVRVTRCLETV